MSVSGVCRSGLLLKLIKSVCEQTETVTVWVSVWMSVCVCVWGGGYRDILQMPLMLPNTCILPSASSSNQFTRTSLGPIPSSTTRGVWRIVSTSSQGQLVLPKCAWPYCHISHIAFYETHWASKLRFVLYWLSRSFVPVFILVWRSNGQSIHDLEAYQSVSTYF